MPELLVLVHAVTKLHHPYAPKLKYKWTLIKYQVQLHQFLMLPVIYGHELIIGNPSIPHGIVNNFLLQFTTTIYNLLQQFTIYYNHLQFTTTIYNLLQQFTIYYNNLQFTTTIYNLLQKFTIYYNNLQFTTKIYNLLQQFTIYYYSFSKYYNLLKSR